MRTPLPRTSGAWVAGLVVAASLLSGCAEMVLTSGSPALDSRFGEAALQARAMQTLNPQASSNRDPVAGIDAQSAQGAIAVYRTSFTQPPPTFNVLNIGGSSLGAGGP
ncbi:MAG: hypothetical protein KJZ83_15955 [Burkholderiaceae bacterium]|nr:hypothetical protein [Burkholderiaceae bacterium]